MWPALAVLGLGLVVAAGLALDVSILRGEAPIGSQLVHAAFVYALCAAVLGRARALHWHAGSAVASLVVVFALNAQLRVSIEHEDSLDIEGSGTLELRGEGRPYRLELRPVRALAVDASRPLFGEVAVRTLILRSPRDASGGALDVQLFVDFVGLGLAADARDLEPLRDQDLPVSTAPIAPGVRSELRMPGSPEPITVGGGTFTPTRVNALDSDDGVARFELSGRLELWLTQDGQDHQLSGTVEAVAYWP